MLLMQWYYLSLAPWQLDRKTSSFTQREERVRGEAGWHGTTKIGECMLLMLRYYFSSSFMLT
jgi:hypothetical protein